MAFGLGAAAYFALPREPQSAVAAAGLLAGVMLLALGARARGQLPKVALILVAFAMAGFSIAKIRAERVRAPLAPVVGVPMRLDGWVVDVAAPGQGGQRLLIAPYRLGDLAPEATPTRVRVTLRSGAHVPSPGSAVKLLAQINPPPPPVSPGAYDFARDAWFESVGGVGFALGPPATWEAPARAPWRLRLAMKINAARWSLARQMVDIMGPNSGGLAAAMTTGQEAFLPREQVDRLRAAGLAHIISISGLHMAIVGGFAFALARLVIASWPWLALRVSGKKCAALVGLAAVGGYLVLSGAPSPAERAAITAAVAFGAVLADRQAISLHALALAAMAVLLLHPEAVTEPGFQMSFAATAALVALAEAWPRPVREINTPWPIRLAQGAGVWLAASLAASLVAGLATGPIAMQHFNRVSTWGLAANLASAPISSFLMMPALAIGAALTPLGLGEAPLAVAGFAIEILGGVARLAQQAPHSELLVASRPGWTLAVAFLGLLWLCLWRGRLRWLGAPFALAVSLVPAPGAPDVWVSADGATAAVRQGRAAILLRPDAKLFGAELWSRRRGLVPAAEGVRDTAFDCDRWSCSPREQAPVRVAAAWNLKRPLKPGRPEALCAGAEVVIVRNANRPPACAAQVLSAAHFARGGAAELYRQPNGRWRVVWAQDLRGRRPWTWGADPRAY